MATVTDFLALTIALVNFSHLPKFFGKAFLKLKYANIWR
jgi:hypothetical protein